MNIIKNNNWFSFNMMIYLVNNFRLKVNWEYYIVNIMLLFDFKVFKVSIYVFICL